ncbi:MAG: histidine phosphatase family protein [Candidatus Hodarchaeales archaeon]
MKIYLIRHGESTANQKKAFQGWNDVHLSKNGFEQGKLLDKYFKANDITFTKIFSSPLIRAVETANSFRTQSSFPEITTLDGLKSINVGDWSGKTIEEIQSLFPTLYNNWKTTPERFRFPGGETISEVLKRARASFEHILYQEAFLEGNIAIVAHMITIKVLMLWMMQVEINKIWDPMFSVPNTGFVIFTAIKDSSVRNYSFTKVKMKDTTPHLHLKG